MKPVKINRFEVWVADHAVPVFSVVAALIVISAGLFLWTYQRQGDTQHQVDVLQPKVTKIVRAAATCSAQTVKEKKTSDACAARLRFALIVCRRSAQCRAALLAIVNYPPPTRGATETSPASRDTGGSGAQNSSPGGSVAQPGSPPGHVGSGHGHGGSHHGSGEGEAPQSTPTPSPSPSAPPSAAPAPEPIVPVPTLPNGKPFPGVGPPGGPPGLQVCALETCIKGEIE